MRFFKRHEQEPQGQPKEASELPVYQEQEDNEPVGYCIALSPTTGMFVEQKSTTSSQKLQHNAQRYFYTERGISAFGIKEWEVVNALVEAGYTCDPVTNGRGRYYTNVPLEHGVPVILSGIDVVRYGMVIATPAQHQRDSDENDKQWRQERRDYYQQRRRKNS